MITATELCKTYDTGKVKVDALRGVNLCVEKGEMIAVMGPQVAERPPSSTVCPDWTTYLVEVLR